MLVDVSISVFNIFENSGPKASFGQLIFGNEELSELLNNIYKDK